MCFPTTTEYHWKLITRQSPNALKLNIFLNNPHVKEEVSGKFLKIHKTKLKLNIKICPKKKNQEKQYLREKFIALNAYIRKEDKSQINKLPPQEQRKGRAK